nr:phage virion morphogenesis protein [Halomonas populi]
MRRSQRERIRGQTNPDGTPYVPRKPQQWRARQGSIRRRAMFGKRDRIKRDGPTIEYPQRELLGFTEQDRTRIRDLLIDHLTRPGH